MLTQQRRKEILEILKTKGAVKVGELTELLDSSESTIRRDLVALADLGKINKVHGGAMVVSQSFLRYEDNIQVKSTRYIEEKEKIAEYAAQQINDDDFVYIDAGSTTFMMTKFLDGSKATFVTNGVDHAKELVKKGCKVYVLGGEIKGSTDAIVGLVAASNLQKYNFSKAFIGTNGISEKQGFTTPDSDEAMLKAVAIERSFVSYVLTDSTKFKRVSAVSFASIDSACIVCDHCTDDSIKKKTVVKEVE